MQKKNLLTSGLNVAVNWQEERNLMKASTGSMVKGPSVSHSTVVSRSLEKKEEVKPI
jgi:hypothetical protein